MRGFNNDSSSLTPTAPKKPRNEEFEKSMKDLNYAFVSSVRHTVKRNPSHSLVPMVKDYLYHSRVLLEQHKKDNSPAVINGINLPPKSFKGLGEFFEDFEKNYVEMKGDMGGGGGGNNTTTTSSLFNKFDSPLSQPLPTPMDTTSAKSSGSGNFSFNTSSSSTSSPTTHTITFNAFGATSTPENPSPKTLSSSPKTSSGSETPSSKPPPSFLTSTFPSMSQPFTLGTSTTSTLGSIVGGSPMKSKPAESESSSKPAAIPPAPAPFKGFSFFTTPAPPSSNSTITSSSTSTAATATMTETTTSNTEEKNDEEGEEDEPPKVEITQVKEDDAVYSIRCKVFGVVDGKCKDKGIGMLYVKKIEGGKYQIVVRADNNLGTVILNILLQKSLPLDKKKNSIVTVDLTANDKKGMPIFIKVKTEDDATELLNKLKEYQQAS